MPETIPTYPIILKYLILSFQTLMNALKAAMDVTLMQLVTTLKAPTTAHVLVNM